MSTLFRSRKKKRSVRRNNCWLTTCHALGQWTQTALQVLVWNVSHANFIIPAPMLHNLKNTSWACEYYNFLSIQNQAGVRTGQTGWMCSQEITFHKRKWIRSVHLLISTWLMAVQIKVVALDRVETITFCLPNKLTLVRTWVRGLHTRGVSTDHHKVRIMTSAENSHTQTTYWIQTVLSKKSSSNIFEGMLPNNYSSRIRNKQNWIFHNNHISTAWIHI